ncbi:MAG TPA: DUF6263 family protein, partial [Planctomycetota bacterium]|nr:DUF6263 family protein [Planctomycetota bacterium]
LAALLLIPASAPPFPQASGQEAAGEKVSLRLNVRKGDRFAYRFTMDTDQSMKMGGADMGSKVQVEKALAYTVEEVAEDGSAWIEVKVGTIRGKMTMPMMGEMEFDTSKPEEEDSGPMAAMTTKPLTAMAGKSFRMKLTASGRLVEVRGVAEAMKGAFGEGGEGGGMMGKVMKDMYTDEGVRKSSEGYFARVPEAPVAPGSAWDTEFDMPRSGPGLDVVFRGKSKLEKADGTEASIATEGTLSMRESPASAKTEAEDPMEAQAAALMRDMKIEKGELRSAMRVSRKDGLPLGSTTESRIEMTMPNPMGGDGTRIRTVTTTKMAMERTALPAEPAAGGPTKQD